jgi:phage antirepressor YoqD-like protein
MLRGKTKEEDSKEDSHAKALVRLINNLGVTTPTSTTKPVQEVDVGNYNEDVSPTDTTKPVDRKVQFNNAFNMFAADLGTVYNGKKDKGFLTDTITDSGFIKVKTRTEEGIVYKINPKGMSIKDRLGRAKTPVAVKALANALGITEKQLKELPPNTMLYNLTRVDETDLDLQREVQKYLTDSRFYTENTPTDKKARDIVRDIAILRSINKVCK